MKMKTTVCTVAAVLGCAAVASASATPKLIGLNNSLNKYTHNGMLKASSAAEHQLGTMRAITPNNEELAIDEYVLSLGYSTDAPCSDLVVELDITHDEYPSLTAFPGTYDIMSSDFNGTGITCMKEVVRVNGKTYTSGNVTFTIDDKTHEYISMTPSETVFDFTQ